MENLIHQLHSLSVRDLSYAVLYAQCATRFPDTMISIPKPEYRTSATTTTYSYQTMAPPPPPPQLWSTHTAPPTLFQAPLAASASTAPSYYRLSPHPEVCSFCYGPAIEFVSALSVTNMLDLAAPPSSMAESTFPTGNLSPTTAQDEAFEPASIPGWPRRQHLR